MNKIVLLGPQRTRPTVAAALKAVGSSGRLAVISAGWQEREGELEPLSAHLDTMELVDLALYARAEQVFETDRDLHGAWREMQESLKELQRLYRRRLRHTLRAARELDDARGIDELIASERADALTALRDLDRQHLDKIRKIQSRHWHDWHTGGRPAITTQRDQIAEQLDGCDTVLIAGGHVAVLLNRLRLFGVAEMIGQRSLVAWSAGAMALSERIVLFHDFPPQGAGDPEVFHAGLGAYRGLIVFPDATRRLALDNSNRVAMLADRLKPADSIALDEDSIMSWDGQHWQMIGATRLLSTDGSVKAFSS